MKVMTKEFRFVEGNDWHEEGFQEVGGDGVLCCEYLDKLFEIPEETTRLFVTLRTEQTEEAFAIRRGEKSPYMDPPDYEIIWRDTETNDICDATFDVSISRLLQEAFKKAKTKVLWASLEFVY